MPKSTPWIAALLALVGLACLPLAAFLGISKTSDYVLDIAQICLIVAVIFFLAYVAIALFKEFKQA